MSVCFVCLQTLCRYIWIDIIYCGFPVKKVNNASLERKPYPGGQIENTAPKELLSLAGGYGQCHPHTCAGLRTDKPWGAGTENVSGPEGYWAFLSFIIPSSSRLQTPATHKSPCAELGIHPARTNGVLAPGAPSPHLGGGPQTRTQRNRIIISGSKAMNESTGVSRMRLLWRVTGSHQEEGVLPAKSQPEAGPVGKTACLQKWKRSSRPETGEGWKVGG